MSNIGSDVPSYHTESTVLDVVYFTENPRPTQREAYIASMTTGMTTNEKIEDIAGAIYDHRVHARENLKEVEDRMNKRFDSLENLLRGFIMEVREQFSGVSARLDKVNVRLDAVENRLDAVDDRLEVLETQSDTLTSVLDEHIKDVKGVCNRLIK